MTVMKALVDKDLCVGCGLCCDVCSEVFEMQENVAVAKVEEVPTGSEDCAKQAASDCPASAIKVE